LEFIILNLVRLKATNGPIAIILWACGIEVLSMLVLSSYPSLIPVLQGAWQLTNVEAGTINGLFFAGELVTVAVVATLTDRYDAKGMYLVFLALGGAAALAFATIADSFASAAALRFLEGAALGGTYMPGLRILTDNVPDHHRSRATSLYTASYYLAAGLSFFLALQLEPAVGWRWTIAACGAGPLVAFVLALIFLPRPPKAERPPQRIFDLRPVFSNRRAVGFSLLYGIHNAELTAFASWLVPFLVFSRDLSAPEVAGADIDLATIAALVSIVALPASIGGNEMGHKFGRQVWIVVVAIGSALTAVAFGFASQTAYWVVLALAFVYSATIAADSSAITGGLIYTADPGRKGATLALDSLIGFSGAAVGPTLFGLILDLAGGERLHGAWIAAFAAMAAMVLIQLIVVFRVVRGPLIYD
jgi:MFS family permease